MPFLGDDIVEFQQKHDFFSCLLRRCEHVRQVESGQAEVSLAQGLVAGNPLGSR
jgi:hypothetical protein